MTPRRIGPDDPAIPAILTLIRDSFAFMDGRVDPPSSMHRLTPDSVAAQARDGEIWAIGTPPVACIFLSPRGDSLYVGKLAVAMSHRRRGLARALLHHAESRARALGLAALELQTRIELEANHATFRAAGFAETGRTAHAGFDRPTSITFRKPVGA